MKDLRIIHTADWHADGYPVKIKKLEASLGQMVDYCKEIKVNAIVIVGDIWDKKQSYTGSSAVSLVTYYLRQLSRLVDFIFITKGNNSHDNEGSISLLHQLEPNIYAYEYPVSLGIWERDKTAKPIDLLRNETFANEVDYIISLVPYPTKSNFITETSIDNNNADFIEKFEDVFRLIADKTKDYKCPKVLGFHGNVVGSRLSTGQTLISQDLMVAPRTLELAKHDYYALGHIHLRQEISPKMIYSGSLYNCNWGETEEKSFEVIEFPESGKMNHCLIPLKTRPMITLNGEFFDNKIDIEGDENLMYAEYRLKIDIMESDRKLISDSMIEDLKDEFGNDVKIEWNIIPAERESRSEKIMNCRSLAEEVREYAEVTDQKINDLIIDKVKEMEEIL